MPNYPKSHQENRLKVCLVCFMRGSGMQRIGGAALPRVQQFFCADYDVNNEFLPAALCARCQGLLLDIERGNRSAEALPIPFDFSKVVPTKETRGHPTCTCCLCEIARESPIGKGLGTWKPEPHPLGRPKTELPDKKELPPARPITICQRCHSVIGRGLGHTCTQTRWLQNVCSELSRDPRGSEIHASDVLKAKLADASADSPIQLATRGRHITLSVSAQSGRPAMGAFGDAAVPASEFARMQVAIGLSGRQTRLAAQFLREWKGRNSIEPNLLHHLTQIDSELDPFYATETIQVICNAGELGTRTVVFCQDVSGLVDYVLARRRMDPGNFLLKIGIDGGRGFLKVCMTMVRSGEQSSSGLPGDGTEASSSRFAEGGVKRLLVIAAVENVPEHYENVQAVLNLLHLEDVSFCSSVDMKLANVLLGLQSSSSAHPCPWCETPRKEFASPQRSVQLRTFGSIRSQAAQYQRVEGQRSSRPSGEPFHNCVRQPLLSWPDDAYTLEAVPPMELHLLMGLVNRLYDELEQRLTAFGPDGVRASQWAEALHVRRCPYHGSQFNGNECDRLLGGVDTLRQILADNAAFSGMPVAQAFSCLRAVQQRCFGQQLLEGYNAAIKEFEAAYHALAINVTPKAHALIDHVPQFLEEMAARSGRRRGLGFWSEQAMESAHRDFSVTWQRFKVDATHPEYARRLLRCVTVYSSRHL